MPNIDTTVTSEEWRPVVGWEGLYEVSDHGQVRSLDRVVPFGAQQRRVNGRILKHGRTLGGVHQVNLCNGAIQKSRAVHVLVLEAFVGPRPDGLDGCHWDDNRDNNTLPNLRWDTRSANMYDAVRNGHNYQTLKTGCPAGHDYNPENTKVGRSGGRWCRECHREDARATYWADVDNQRRIKREAQRRRRARLKAEAVA